MERDKAFTLMAVMVVCGAAWIIIGPPGVVAIGLLMWCLR